MLLSTTVRGGTTLHLGYTRVDVPHPFGAVLRLPEPFNLGLDTSGLWPA
ncbi:hypothetical protein ACIOHC_43635 [Streptomyces sp. NPDC088252]